MVDIDMADDHYLSTEEIVELTKIIVGVVNDFFNSRSNVICCVSDKKTKSDKIHTGIHLIWNSIFVTDNVALCVRTGIIERLVTSDSAKDWETIIDELIYTRNGYRMVGSDKLDKNKKPENRPLKLLFVMDNDGQLNDVYFNRLKTDYKALMLDTSIRYVLDAYITTGMKIRMPVWASEKVETSSCLVVVGNKEFNILQKFVNENLPAVYRNTIKSISRYPDKNMLITTSSRYCMNNEKCHNSCGIYLFANPKGVYQKCLCPCNKIRTNGYCRDYTSSCYPFDVETFKVLFPKKQFIPAFKPNDDGSSSQMALCNKLFNELTS
jgi:hypothetical protein